MKSRIKKARKFDSTFLKIHMLWCRMSAHGVTVNVAENHPETVQFVTPVVPNRKPG
jgi:hypothetical protein